MPKKYNTSTFNTFNTEALENALVSTCNGNLQIRHRLALRALALSLKYDAEMKKQGVTNQNHVEPLKALTNFKANLQRRKKTSDTLTNRGLMKVPEPVGAILLSDIAYTFRDEINDPAAVAFPRSANIITDAPRPETRPPVTTFWLSAATR